MTANPPPASDSAPPAEAVAPRLFLIDGANLAYRSHFAFVKNPLVNSKGLNTSGPFGFTQTLLKLLKDEKPDYIAVVWDPEGATERSLKFADYKATRERMPDEMADSLPYIDRIVAGCRVAQIEMPGVEADDVIGTLAVRAADRGIDVYVVSSDKDFLQLVRPNLRVYNLRKGWSEREVMGPAETREKWGVGPERIRDVLALMGDASDNIPGVPGVGEKTAVELVGQFGSFEAVLARAGEVKRKNVREALLANPDGARLSYDLVTIRTDVPVELDLDHLRRKEPNSLELAPLFVELEFNQFLPLVAPPRREVALDYRVVRTAGELDAMVAALAAAPDFSFDSETTGLDPHVADIVGLSFSCADGRAWYAPTAVPGMPGTLFSRPRLDKAQLDLVLAKIRPLLASATTRKGGQNAKYDVNVLARHGIEVQGLAFDTMVASYLLDPAARAHNLDALSIQYLNLPKIPTEALIGKGKAQISMLEVPVEEVARYACEDADFTLRLHHVFEPRLRAMEVERLYREVELPLVLVLARMERMGVKIDAALLGRLGAEHERRLDALAEEIYALAGERFNIDSPKQLAPILFEKLEVQKPLGVRVRRTQTGYSTDAEVLEQLDADPCVKKVLAYRSLRKLLGTYIEALPALVGKDGLLHTHFNQAVAATGRLSSSDPNLQNIPVRTEEGKRIRAAFVPRLPGGKIISCDYSQIELRVLAHVSGDETLVEAFRRGEDVHRATAARVFGVEPAAVTSELRSKAKVINFGIIYGMGPQRLARETGMTQEEAARFIEQYFEKFPGIKRTIDETIAACERAGYVQTLFGRRRLLPEIVSANPRMRAAARNMAVNTPIQGTAADLIKVAMIEIDRRLIEKSYRTRMILQVHDELVFDAPADEVEAVTALAKTAMEGAFPGFRVPLKVDAGAGANWLEAH